MDLLEKIEKYLESTNLGEVTDKDLENLSEIVEILISSKYRKDEKGFAPIKISILNKTKYKELKNESF